MRHAIRLLSLILAESASSRLFQSLREERGLCYQIGSDVTFFEDTGAFEIVAGLDPDSRDGALTTGWLMATQPCGLWQITPMHTPRGYGQYIEVTGFPLGAGEDRIPLLLCHVRLTDTLLHTGDHKFSMESATQFNFIDVGCGIPEWAL